MCPMQERTYGKRGEQYLLIKSPPASGKSRALMFITLDKLDNQGLRQAIVVMPERTIGASFNDEPLSRFGYWADWAVRPKWNLCNAPAKTVAKKFLSASCVGRSTVGAPSAKSVFSTSSSSRSTSSLRARPRTSWRPRRRRPGPQRSRASSAASRRASPFPSIYRANAWWCWGSRPARAAGRRGCRRSART